MIQDLSTLDIYILQSLLTIESERFISSLDDGTSLEELQPIQQRIKEIRQLIDRKQAMGEGNQLKETG